MCKGKCKEKMRSYDSFGAPIGVTFNGESSYKTAIGGAVTIVLLIILGVNLSLNLLDLYTNGRYARHETNSYKPNSSNAAGWTMDTKN